MSAACRREPEVLHAAADDRWTDALRAHVAECEECRTAASVAPWMTRFARMSDREHILPDPQVVWLKAQILRGDADVDRATRPLNVIQMVAYFLVASGWAWLLTRNWSSLERWARSMSPIELVSGSGTAQMTLPVSFYMMLFFLACVTVMLALHTILAEE